MTYRIASGISRPIDEYRRMLYVTAEEFSRQLGISAQTYRKITRGGDVELPLQRKIAAALGLPTPALIAEFSWKPSQATLASYDADITATNAVDGQWLTRRPARCVPLRWCGYPTERAIDDHVR